MLLPLLVAVAAVAAAVWFAWRGRALTAENAAVREQAAELRATLASERAAHADRVRLLEDAERRLSDAFKAISAEALAANNQAFLTLAENEFKRHTQTAQRDFGELVGPVRESLTRVSTNIDELEKNRIGAYEGLREQVRNLIETQQQLRGEAARLVNALRTPAQRGRWGEVQLRRVVEMAGMVERCDFTEQQGLNNGRLRPDVIVHLPGGRFVVVDSKTPLAAYLEAYECDEPDARRLKLKQHASQVRTHVTKLAEKAYWSQLDGTPEFVVAFLPGEAFFSAALEHDPELLEYSVDRKVILSTPTTLIALLKAVAYGWRQEKLAEEAKRIGELGNDLYARILKMHEHFAAVGRELRSAVEAYNSAVGSIDNRVLPAARKFREMAAPESADLDALNPVDVEPRAFQAPEWRAAGAANGDAD